MPPHIIMPGRIPTLAAWAAVAALSLRAAGAWAQAPLPSMECGRMQGNLHIRCTAVGVPALVRDHRAYWTDVPGKVALKERYVDEAECHADLEARCEQISTLASSYSTVWTFDQALGSRGCEAGAGGNGWIDPYLVWRTRVVLPRRLDDKTWLLTIVASSITPPTIRAYPNAGVAVAACHLLITGAGTSKDIPISRNNATTGQRELLSRFNPGEYLAELQCPAIQGSDCAAGKASLSLQITASPED